jgi:signal transduction histidine kinase
MIKRKRRIYTSFSTKKGTSSKGNPQAFIALTRDITERKRAEQLEQQRLAGLAFLSESAMGLVTLQPADDIYRFIARRLHWFVTDSYIGISSYDAEANQFHVRAVAGVDDRLGALLKRLGLDPMEIRFQLQPTELEECRAAKLNRIEGGIPALMGLKLPRFVLQALELASAAGNVYAMPLYRQDQVLGQAIIVLRRGKSLTNPGVVETFVNQAAIALQRKLAEDEVARHRQHLEELVEERTRELKQAQADLVRKERLAALGQVAGSVAHEIRGPLGVIRNAVYYLNLTQKDTLPPKATGYLQLIDDQVERSNRIVSSLLDFARGRPAQPDKVGLDQVLTESQAQLAIPETVSVVKVIPSGFPALFVDPVQIQAALANLMRNAVQAMPEGGILTIEAGANNAHATIKIQDTGCGIAPENMSRLFEPLFSTRTAGVGLGLAISRNFTEGSGGKIEVESEPGKGSTFTVTLPLAEEGKRA